MSEEEKAIEEIKALRIKVDNGTATPQDIANANELLDFYGEDE